MELKREGDIDWEASGGPKVRVNGQWIAFSELSRDQMLSITNAVAIRARTVLRHAVVKALSDGLSHGDILDTVNQELAAREGTAPS